MSNTLNHLDNNVLILAGGLGTRLKSILPDAPKALAKINGQPFLKILTQRNLVRFAETRYGPFGTASLDARDGSDTGGARQQQCFGKAN